MNKLQRRAKAQKLYEKGDSLLSISKVVKVHYNTIRKWKEDETWEQGKSLPRIQAAMEGSIMAQAAKHGLTLETYFEKMAEFLEAQKSSPIIKLDANDKPIEGSEEFVNTPDYKTQIEGLKLMQTTLPGLKVEKHNVTINHIEPFVIKNIDGEVLEEYHTKIPDGNPTKPIPTESTDQ